MFWFLGHEMCGILAPRLWNELASPAAEALGLNHRTYKKSLIFISLKEY